MAELKVPHKGGGGIERAMMKRIGCEGAVKLAMVGDAVELDKEWKKKKIPLPSPLDLVSYRYLVRRGMDEDTKSARPHLLSVSIGLKLPQKAEDSSQELMKRGNTWV